MKRSFLLYFLISVVGFIFIGRLFQLQVINANNSESIVENATVKTIYDYPQRGYIYDRNGKLLVANQISYDVLITPNQVKNIDTLELCSLLKINKKTFLKKYKRAKEYATWLPSVFLKQLSKQDYAFLQEKMYKFKGFDIQKRIIRSYPIASAANVLGYIGEVNEEISRKNKYYQQGELIGKDGVERQYEKELRGVKGKKYLTRNNLNKITGSFKNGILDTLAINGQDLTLTIDTELQQYAEKLMIGKRGGIVAIEPSSGEILALVTAPSYNPNMLVGRERSKNSVILMSPKNLDKPTFDRALKASYAPGSPFKMMNALIGLQEGVINNQTSFRCFGGYRYGKRINEFMKCHCDIYNKPIRLKTAIARSCNSYFSSTFKLIVEKNNKPSEGLDNWSKHVKSFGLGNYLGYDLPAGSKGRIPTGTYYNNSSNYNFRWNASSIISNAIGQGDVETTPIQLANFTAAIANKGFFFTPHIVKKIGNKPVMNTNFTTPKTTTIDTKHFAPVIDAMHEVFKKGTGKYSQVKGIKICGKTGTAENFAIVQGHKVQLEDHSILVAFAPKNNPKIALAIYVENGGYGSTIAAPITSLLIEKYINGKISSANKYRETNMIHKSLRHIYDMQIKKTDTIERGKK